MHQVMDTVLSVIVRLPREQCKCGPKGGCGEKIPVIVLISSAMFYAIVEDS